MKRITKYKRILEELTNWDKRILLNNNVLRINEETNTVEWIDDNYAGVFNYYRELFKMGVVKIDENGNWYVMKLS